MNYSNRLCLQWWKSDADNYDEDRQQHMKYSHRRWLQWWKREDEDEQCTKESQTVAAVMEKRRWGWTMHERVTDSGSSDGTGKEKMRMNNARKSHRQWLQWWKREDEDEQCTKESQTVAAVMELEKRRWGWTMHERTDSGSSDGKEKMRMNNARKSHRQQQWWNWKREDEDEQCTKESQTVTAVMEKRRWGWTAESQTVAAVMELEKRRWGWTMHERVTDSGSSDGTGKEKMRMNNARKSHRQWQQWWNWKREDEDEQCTKESQTVAAVMELEKWGWTMHERVTDSDCSDGKEKMRMNNARKSHRQWLQWWNWKREDEDEQCTKESQTSSDGKEKMRMNNARKVTDSGQWWNWKREDEDEQCTKEQTVAAVMELEKRRWGWTTTNHETHRHWLQHVCWDCRGGGGGAGGRGGGRILEGGWQMKNSRHGEWLQGSTGYFQGYFLKKENQGRQLNYLFRHCHCANI